MTKGEGMEKQKINETMKTLYNDLHKYFDPYSEYGVGYADGIYDVCAKLGVQCSKVDEGTLRFGD